MTARTVRCEHCDQLLQFTDAQREIRCHTCGKTTIIPKALAEMPTPILPGDAGGLAAEAHPADETHEAFQQPKDPEGRRSIMAVVANSTPWTISLLAHVGIGLILVFVAMLTLPKVDAKPYPPPKIGDFDIPPTWNPPPEHETPPTENPDDRLPGVPNQSDYKDRPADPDFGEPNNEEVDLIGPGLVSGDSPFDGDEDGRLGQKGIFGTIRLGAPAGDVVFVIDRSGSMTNSFRIVVQEMLCRIGGMDGAKRGQRFHVILFAEDAPMEFDARRLVPATRANKEKVAAFLADKHATGRTNPVAALERAFQVLKAGRGKKGKVIFLLTDGVFPDNEAVLRTINKHNATKGVSVCTILFGDRPVEADRVMKQIATENGGQYKYVSPDELD